MADVIKDVIKLVNATKLDDQIKELADNIKNITGNGSAIKGDISAINDRINDEAIGATNKFASSYQTEDPYSLEHYGLLTDANIVIPKGIYKDKQTITMDPLVFDYYYANPGSSNSWESMILRKLSIKSGSVLPRGYYYIGSQEAPSISEDITIHFPTVLNPDANPSNPSKYFYTNNLNVSTLYFSDCNMNRYNGVWNNDYYFSNLFKGAIISITLHASPISFDYISSNGYNESHSASSTTYLTLSVAAESASAGCIVVPVYMWHSSADGTWVQSENCFIGHTIQVLYDTVLPTELVTWIKANSTFSELSDDKNDSEYT